MSDKTTYLEAERLYWSLSSAHRTALTGGKKVLIDLDSEMLQAYGIIKYSNNR